MSGFRSTRFKDSQRLREFASNASLYTSGILHDEIMADAPAWYYRLNETSGTAAAEEGGGTNATYTSCTLNQPTLYPSGPVCAQFNGTTSKVVVPATEMPSATALTLVAVIKPTSISNNPHIISRDGTARLWQFYIPNTGAIQFTKIVGGVESAASSASQIAAGTPYIVMVTVSTGGAVNIYKNGANIKSATITPANYGHATESIHAGDFARATGQNIAGYMSEIAGFTTELNAARASAYAHAAGFA